MNELMHPKSVDGVIRYVTEIMMEVGSNIAGSYHTYYARLEFPLGIFSIESNEYFEIVDKEITRKEYGAAMVKVCGKILNEDIARIIVEEFRKTDP